MEYTKIELKGYRRLQLNNIQLIRMEPKSVIQLILGTNGSGKAQPLSSLIKVPGGWCRMDDLKIDDLVTARDGTSSKITNILPQGIKQVFRITFEDGRSALATGDHLWKVYIGGIMYPNALKIMTTCEILQRIVTDRLDHLLFIDLTEPEQIDDIELPVDPYVLGVIVGDVCISGGTVETLLGPESSSTINYLKEAGLYNKRSYEKFIPDLYLHASSKQRLEVLRGLMDTNGYLDDQGTCSFSSISKDLASNVQYLVRSLGGIASIILDHQSSITNRDTQDTREAYRVNIRYQKPAELFTLSRKKIRTKDDHQHPSSLKLRIERVEPSTKEECQCIVIDHPEHLYITNDFIVTHNSSLLREITPLPSNHTQYDKDGYKLLELTHRNHQYQVVNRFDGKAGRYQLVKDGQDIFSGTTATDFRSLIKQEFGITPEIQSLVDGVTKFSTMDVAKRRYWFTLLSKVDYTYAFQFYSHLRSRIRDLQGSLTISQNRYASELTKVLSEEEILKTRERLESYQKILQYLLETKPRLVHPRSDTEKRIKERDQQIVQVCKRLDLVKATISKSVVGLLSNTDLNIDTCQQAIYRYKALLENEHSRMRFLHQKLIELNNIGEKDQRLHKLSEEDLEKQRERISMEILEIERYVTLIPTLSYPVHEFKSSLESVYHHLSEILSQLPPESGETISRCSKEIAIKRYQELDESLVSLKGQIQKQQIQIQEMEYAKVNNKRNCPKCHYEWYHGYQEHIYLAAKNRLEIDLNKESNIVKDLERVKDQISEIDRVFDLRSRMAHIVRSWPILEPLWKVLLTHQARNPVEMKGLLENVLRDLPGMFKLESLREALKEVQELLELSKVRSSSDVERHLDLMRNTEQELCEVQEKIRSYEECLRSTSKVLEYLDNTIKMRTELELLIDQRDKEVISLKEALLVEHFNRLIMIFRQEVSSLEQSISRIDIQQGLILQLKQQIEDHEDQIRLLKYAEQAMSPSTGLIAKGLTGFINRFILKMNQFVKQIWTHPLEILPISLTDELDLDYKFPIQVDHRFGAPDIKSGECNVSTCEIFDLAYRIVAMEYLSLRDIPLQLDEFGGSFDPKHRNIAFQVVSALTLSTNVPQIFLVSHHEQNYGGLKNVDLTVLHDENIVLPKDVLINERTYIL